MYVVYCAGWYNPDNDAVILDLVSTIISHTYQVKKKCSTYVHYYK